MKINIDLLARILNRYPIQTLEFKTIEGIVLKIDVSKNEEYWTSLVYKLLTKEEVIECKNVAKNWIKNVKRNEIGIMSKGYISGIKEIQEYTSDYQGSLYIKYFFDYPGEKELLGLFLLYGFNVEIKIL